MPRQVLLPIVAILFGSQAYAQSGWSALNSGTFDNLNDVAVPTPTVCYAVGAGSTVVKSTDAGASWTDVSPTITSADLRAAHFFDSLVGIAAGDGGVIVRTTDGGGSWSTVPQGLGSVPLYSVTFDVDNGVIGAAAGAILNSTDSGQSWAVAVPTAISNDNAGADMVDAMLGFVGGQNAIFQPIVARTTDGGATWTYTTFYYDGNEGWIEGVDFVDASNGHLVGVRWDGLGAASRSTDGGQSWTHVYQAEALYDVHFPDGAGMIGYDVGAMGSVYKTSDAGATWSKQTTPTSSTLRGVRFVDVLTGYAVGDGGTILRTTTGGEACPSITISPASIPDGTEDVPYLQTFTASGGVPPYTWAASGALPAGLTLNAATGELSGTPSLAGSFTFDVTVIDSTGCTGARRLHVGRP